MDDSMDGSPPPSIASSVETPISTPMGTPSTHTTHSRRSGKGGGKKLVTGYIIYASEVRKHVAEKNPNVGFGEISRIVGNDVCRARNIFLLSYDL